MSDPKSISVIGSDNPVTEAALDHQNASPHNFWWFRFKRRAQRLWSDTWILEITALILSSACGVGVYATLGSLDGQPLPSMPRTLTLNTIIAFLSTVAKSALVLVVSSCIGQLKWKWYQQSRSVQDVRLFDDASRGPLGSFQMLIEQRGKSIACLGALILILTLLFDPFMQQAVVYPSFSVLQPSSSAQANQSRVFLEGLQADYGVPSIAQEALNAGIWSQGFDPKPYCPSSDCAWDTFTSLGLCSSCGPANPPPQLDCTFNTQYPPTDLQKSGQTFDSKTCVIKFRDGQVSHPLDINFQYFQNVLNDGNIFRVIAPEYAVFNVYTGERTIKDQFYDTNSVDLINDTIQGVRNPLLALAAIQFSLTDTSLTIAKADECTLNFCLRDYTMTITNNTPEVVVSNVRNGVGTASLPSFARGFSCWVAENETFPRELSHMKGGIGDGSYDCNQVAPSVIEDGGPTEYCSYDGTYLFDPEHFSFCMTNTYGPYLNWGGGIAHSLVGNVSQYITVQCPEEDQPDSQCQLTGEPFLMDDSSIEAYTGSNYTTEDVILHTRLTGLDVVVPNVAESITLLNMQHNGTTVTGRAGNPVTHVHVRWAWLALPSSLLGAGAYLFLYTFIDTKRHAIGLWKSSALALLYHGLEAEELEHDSDVEKVSGMEYRAAKLKVRCKPGDGQGRTVLQNSHSAPPPVIIFEARIPQQRQAAYL